MIENEKAVGKITHYFDKAKVAVVEVLAPIKVGDKISIKGNTTEFEQVIDSMQVEHEKIKSAKKGQAIGLKVNQEVRIHDLIYIVS